MSEHPLEEYINSELHCTNCGRTVHIRMSRFDTGNLTIDCPICDHEHFRYVVDGIITEDRWRSSAMQVYSTTAWVSTVSTTSTTTASDTHGFYGDSWTNSSTSGTWG